MGIYHGQRAVIDINEADEHEVNISEFKIFTHNLLEFSFAVKKHLIKIKNLLLHYGSFNYLGGAQVENIEIITNSPCASLKSGIAKNVSIQTKFNEDEKVIRKLLGGIAIIPGCGEYVLNKHTAEKSLNELKGALPNVKWIALVVTWFADSLDIGSCKILPAVEKRDFTNWKVANHNKDSAHLISHNEVGEVNYGGSIDDEGIVQFLSTAKAKNFNVIFYPLIMVDIAKKPWRGRITGKAENVEAYQNYYKPFILHYAKLSCGKIDAFIIGSELLGLTRIHDEQGNFPFIKKLIELAIEVKQILGSYVRLIYAADWSEYHTADGCLRPLGELWASPNIDFVGIDAYFPITDSKKSRISIEEIKDGWQGGKGWDYWVDHSGQKHSFNNEG